MGRILSNRLTSALVPFAEAKDAVKFVCKDFWMYNFRQQASRLQANRKGVFMVHDTNFPLLQTLARACIPFRISSEASSHAHSLDDGSTESFAAFAQQQMDPAVSARALSLLQFPAGLISGFLDSCGYPSVVEPSLTGHLPACAFSITVNDLESTILKRLRGPTAAI